MVILFAFFLIFWISKGQNLTPAELADEIVPNYHIPMLNDVTRNEAFYKALSKVITAESIVIDVGAGSGLLSCMAAKLGAKRVFAIEQREKLCTFVLTQIISSNNFSDIIEPICRSSEFVTAEDLMFQGPNGPEAPTVLVSETLDSYIIGEGFTAMLYDLKVRRVINENIAIIPHHGRLHMNLIQSSYLLNESLTVHGFNFSALDAYRLRGGPEITIVGRFNEILHLNLSETIPVFDLNFQESTDQDDYFRAVTVKIPIMASGRLTSAMFYFQVWLDAEEEITVDNFISTPTHWGQLEQILDWTEPVRPGDMLHLQVALVSQRIYIANKNTSRLLRINCNCTERVNIYASKPNQDCDILNDDHYEFFFYGDSALEYNLVVAFEGQVFIAQLESSGKILPVFVVKDNVPDALIEQSSIGDSIPVLEHTFDSRETSSSTTCKIERKAHKAFKKNTVWGGIGSSEWI